MRSQRLATLVLLALVACQTPTVGGTPSPASPTALAVATPSPTILATPTATALATATPTTTPLPTAVASPSPRPTDPPRRLELSAAVRPKAVKWAPTGPTAIVQESTVLWAVPIVSGPNGIRGTNVELAAAGWGGWAVRPDGSAFVFSVRTGDYGPETRLALWDAANGIVRWLTPLDEGGAVHDPVWSIDGREVFFARSRGQDAGYADLGIWRIQRDGSGLAQVIAGDPLSKTGHAVHGVTPDGRGLVWGVGSIEGPDLRIRDLASGADRRFAPAIALAAAWRAVRPRALVARPGNFASSLVLWDDLDPPSQRELVSGPNPSANGADWDPAERLIVTLVASELGKASLVIVDGEGRLLRTLPGTEGADTSGVAGRLLWEPDGILYQQAREIWLIRPEGSVPQVLFGGRNSTPLLRAVVRP